MLLVAEGKRAFADLLVPEAEVMAMAEVTVHHQAVTTMAPRTQVQADALDVNDVTLGTLVPGQNQA